MSFAGNMKTIVVATDLNGRCEGALDYARKLALAYGARLVLAHGIDPLDCAAVDTVTGSVLQGLTEHARAVIDQMKAGLLRDGIPSHSEIRQGMIVTMLLDVARQQRAGLIVIGTRGNRGAGPIAVGVIAEQLVRQSRCPVLAVAEDWNAGEFRPAPGGPIVLAIDAHHPAGEAIDAASSLARCFKRPLLVVHARKTAETAAFLNPPATTLEDFGIQSDSEFPVRCLVRDGHPADAISRTIEQYKASILVAGVKPSSNSVGLHGTILSMLARSRVPVLCVPVSPVHTIEEVRSRAPRSIGEAEHRMPVA